MLVTALSKDEWFIMATTITVCKFKKFDQIKYIEAVNQWFQISN